MKKLLPYLVLLLAACGQAGPLVLPDDAAAPKQQEEPKKKDAGP